MDEILLGRPFFKSIGFDLKEHLMRNRYIIQDPSGDNTVPYELSRFDVYQ